jgi:hypothetical protein
MDWFYVLGAVALAIFVAWLMDKNLQPKEKATSEVPDWRKFASRVEPQAEQTTRRPSNGPVPSVSGK